MIKKSLIFLFLFFNVGFLFSAQQEKEVSLSLLSEDDNNLGQDNHCKKVRIITPDRRRGFNLEEDEQGISPSSSPEVRKDLNHLLPVDLSQYSRLKAGGFEHFLTYIQSLKDFTFISSSDASPSDSYIVILSKLEQLLFRYFNEHPQYEKTFNRVKFLDLYFGKDFTSFTRVMHVLFPKE